MIQHRLYIIVAIYLIYYILEVYMSILKSYCSEGNDFVKIAGPMVRYSKLPFRMLVRQNGCDLACTPMIMAKSFTQSEKARQAEFSTCPEDRPLIVQFASNIPSELAAAVELVHPYCDGVDLNCGCPQRWAIQEQVGSYLLRRSDLSCELVRSARAAAPSRVPDELHPHGFSISCKIRLVPNYSSDNPHASPETTCGCVNSVSCSQQGESRLCLRHTVDHCRQLMSTGALDWLTVHCRFPWQRAEPANWNALSELVYILQSDSIGVPLVLNGDVTSIESARQAHRITGCAGIMAAQGLLTNPALFTETEEGVTDTRSASLACVETFVRLSLEHGTQFNIFHRHLIWMLDTRLSRTEKKLFANFNSMAAIIDFLRDEYGICRV